MINGEKIKKMKDIEDLKNDLKLCYRRIAAQKMRIMDRIGFSYRGKHYALVRDE